MDRVVATEDPMIDVALLRDQLDAEVLVTSATNSAALADAATGADALEAMREDAILLNTGRGGLLEGEALAAALADGTIAAAGLDVLREEPPATDHPLLGLDNCIVTPHAAWYSEEVRDDLNGTVVENVRAGLAGKRPPEYVDPGTAWL